MPKTPPLTTRESEASESTLTFVLAKVGQLWLITDNASSSATGMVEARTEEEDAGGGAEVAGLPRP